MESREANAHYCAAIARAASVNLGRALLMIAILILGAQATQAAPDVVCSGGALPDAPLIPDLPDLRVEGDCSVQLGKTYYFKNVNILSGGSLVFNNAANSHTDFWASSIIIENRGSLAVGAWGQSFGSHGAVLTIHLYGKDEAQWDPITQKFVQQNQGALCKSPTGSGQSAPCGIDQAVWDDNGKSRRDLPGVSPDKAETHVKDYFYQYGPLHGDAGCTQNPRADKCEVGYFGNKVLAVSYGGILDLEGVKGTIPAGADSEDLLPLSSGWSWRRLADGNSLAVGATTLYLENKIPPLFDAFGGPWAEGDEIVVTTTDYLPGHSEKLKVKHVSEPLDPLIKLDFDAVDNPKDPKTGVQKTGVLWPHNGVRYGGPNDPAHKKLTDRLPGRLQKSLDDDLVKNGAETRAAVALLTRSIQIVSAGDAAGADFGYHTLDDQLKDQEDVKRGGKETRRDPRYSYGAHMVIRQGFEIVTIRGVEFRQMGQGGRIGHYPVHFHMARIVPADTYIKDSSINESMTRWIVLHSTQGVTVARNVGYKSIGHGFYLEDGTETDNRFYSNIGIFARAAVANVNLDTGVNFPNPQNPRMIPGILADNTDPASFKAPDVPNSGFIYRSDVENPSVFWITNGWNDFIGNMAAGAGTCGAAYWFVPVANADMIETSATHEHMKWDGYAGLQMPAEWPGTSGRYLLPGMAGATPLKSFYKNYATSTMHSFQTTPDAPACDGVIAADAKPGNFAVLRAVPSLAPKPAHHLIPPVPPNQHREADTLNDHYYPHIAGARQAVHCPITGNVYDCSKVTQVCAHPPSDNCAATVLDHFTSAFHWANGNVSAIWLRPQWYLLTNSVLSDVQNGGVTFITGGDYTHSSVIDGYWGLAKSSLFIGNTNPNPDPNNRQATEKYAYTGNAGPFNALSPLKCDPNKVAGDEPNYCLNANETISMSLHAFFTNQRLANIYDGPSYQDSNAYLDITTADCEQGAANSGCMYGTKKTYLRLKRQPGVPESKCYLPNAAIGWKSPNGFFYPPAFHSRNLFFDNVDLRHYVIDPLFKVPDGVPSDKNFGQQGTYLTDNNAVKDQYCVESARYNDLFNDFTSIERQTELNDDDGTLTGLSNSLPDGPLKQTISINEDPFFSAPRETAECGSAIGDNAQPKTACDKPDPKQPPVTARTSPYDYVATMLYHKQRGLRPGQSENDLDADVWGSVCSNQSCYGVPLYRQYLTKEEQNHWRDWKCSEQAGTLKPKPECRWPFIRMSGENLSQRETLTINNGVYYVDTTVSRNTQETENYTSAYKGKNARSRNVFQAGETYYVFFAYAKPSTVQTYQIYVGTDFDAAKEFKPGRLNVDDLQGDQRFLEKPVQDEKWVKTDSSEVKRKGILTVNIDFTVWKGTELDLTPDNGLCQPRTFCMPGSDRKSCVSALKSGDPLIAANKDFAVQNEMVCKEWAVKDLDCPPSSVTKPASG
jgi:hypothetical protein